MANPNVLSQRDYSALTIVPLNNMIVTSNLMGSNFSLAGRVRNTNQIAFTANIQGSPSLTESRSGELSLSGVDLSKASTTVYYTYDIGMDPVSNTWAITITGSAGNTCVFKKSNVGADR